MAVVFSLLVMMSLVMDLVLAEGCPDTGGKHYLAMFTQNLVTHHGKMRLYVTSSRPHAVEVKVHYGNDSTTVYEFTLLPGGFHQVMFNNSIELPAGNVVRKMAVLVVSSDDVIVQLVNDEASNGDMYTVWESLYLGKEYFAVAPRGRLNNAYSTIAIAALHGSTSVYIRLPSSVSNLTVDVMGVSVNFAGYIELELSSRDVLQLQTPADLSGTHIYTDKPAAVVSGVNRTSILGNCGDSFQDQILPTSSLGTEYIVFTLSSEIKNGSVFVYIIPTEDNTNVSYSSVNIHIPTSGEQAEVELSRWDYDFVMFRSSAPVLMGMVPQSGATPDESVPVEGDVALVYIQPLPFVSSVYTLFVPKNVPFGNQKRRLVLIIESAFVGGLLLDDRPVNTSWQTVPGTSYSGAYIKAAYTGSSTVIRHRSGKSFGAYLVGYKSCECYMLAVKADIPLTSQCKETSSQSITDPWLSIFPTKGKRMMSQVLKKVSFPDVERCIKFCLQFDECIGINFSKFVAVQNCEILFSHVHCEENNSTWTFYGL